MCVKRRGREKLQVKSILWPSKSEYFKFPNMPFGGVLCKINYLFKRNMCPLLSVIFLLLLFSSLYSKIEKKKERVPPDQNRE